MIAIAMTVLRFAWPFLLLGGAYLWADNAWENNVAKRLQKSITVVTSQRDAAEAKLAALDKLRIAQQERHLQLTAAEELRQRAQDAERTKRFQPIRKQAAGEYRGIAITDTARKLLGDAYAAAQDAEAPREPDKATPADPGSSTVGDLIVWSVDMLEWASVCRDRVDGWQQWYESLGTDVPDTPNTGTEVPNSGTE